MDLLNKYARDIGGVAQYLLYNFTPLGRHTREFAKIPQPENYGITHISTVEIIKWMDDMKRAGKKPTPHFNDFHPGLAFPFHELICLMLTNDDPFDDLFPLDRMKKIRYYSEDEVADAPTWREVTVPAKIAFLESSVLITGDDYQSPASAQANRQKQLPVFSPKYRIVIGGEIQQGGLYEIS